MTARRESLSERQEEFKSHVWNHSVDEFQMEFDERPPLPVEAQLRFFRLSMAIGFEGGLENIAAKLDSELKDDPQFIFAVMQLVGLTRSKILSDLKAALPNLKRVVPNSAHLLPQRPEAWKLARLQLAARLIKVLGPVGTLDFTSVKGTLEALNQATWPGWIRQERAKRQGHAAEGRLAVMLQDLGIPFVPEGKSVNPMCPDATFEELSFDIMVPSLDEPRLCVKATVHTANIGQYGESKDHLEVAEASEMLKRLPNPPILMALIDGIGFYSNSAGLNGVLTTADEFCQFETLWKAGVIAAHQIGRKVQLVLGDADAHKSFLDRYSKSIVLKTKVTKQAGWVQAGEASIMLIPEA